MTSEHNSYKGFAETSPKEAVLFGRNTQRSQEHIPWNKRCCHKDSEAVWWCLQWKLTSECRNKLVLSGNDAMTNVLYGLSWTVIRSQWIKFFLMVEGERCVPFAWIFNRGLLGAQNAWDCKNASTVSLKWTEAVAKQQHNTRRSICYQSELEEQPKINFRSGKGLEFQRSSIEKGPLL